MQIYADIRRAVIQKNRVHLRGCVEIAGAKDLVDPCMTCRLDSVLVRGYLALPFLAVLNSIVAEYC